MSAEEWRPIPGYSDYDVSDSGRIRSYRNRWGRRATPRLLALRVRIMPSSHTTYRQVRLVDSQGRMGEHFVHRLVLAAFIGPCPDGQMVRHLNGDGSDNSLQNLRYGTGSENQLDSVRHGTNFWARRTHCAQGHPLSGDNLVIRSDNRARACRTCLRAKWRANNQRRRSA